MEANTLVAGDEQTCLALKTKACSAKDGTRLILKANMFGAREELTRLAIETNTFGTGGKRVSQQTTHTFAG